MLFDLENVRLDRTAGTGYRLDIARLTLRHGECVAVTGPSGCGKSTMLDLLGMTLKPSRVQTFRFAPSPERPIDVAALWRAGDLDAMAALRRTSLGYVLQTGELLPFLSVAENIALTARLAGFSEAEAQASVRRLAHALGIAHLLGKKPAQISIGERQRAAVARALAHLPRVILADEPTASLDPAHARETMKLLLEAARSQRAALILVSHDWTLVREFGLREILIRVSTDKSGRSTARIGADS